MVVLVTRVNFQFTEHSTTQRAFWQHAFNRDFNHTRFTQRAAEAAYQRGLTSRLQATEARLPVLAEEMSLLMLDSRRVIQSIQLMKSLGGGYQASPVVEKK